MRRVLASKPFAWVIALALGASLGTGAALWQAHAKPEAATRNGWRDIGAASTGLNALNPKLDQSWATLSLREGRAYLRDRDDDGRPLDEDCAYALEGPPLPARWWSATLYTSKGAFIPDADAAFSINATRMGPAADTDWSVRVASVKGDAPFWLSSRAARRGFVIVLRAYHARGGFATVQERLPHLRRLTCLERLG